MAKNKIRSAQIETQESWATPTLSTGWIAFDAGAPGGYGTPQYMKDSLGFVHLKGLCKNNSGGANTTTTNSIMFVLPAGYRPAWTTIINAMGDDVSKRVDILTGGNVVLGGVTSVPNAAWMSVNNITFKAEA